MGLFKGVTSLHHLFLSVWTVLKMLFPHQETCWLFTSWEEVSAYAVRTTRAYNTLHFLKKVLISRNKQAYLNQKKKRFAFEEHIFIAENGLKGSGRL